MLTIAQRTDLVGEAGQLEPRGVIAGILVAMVTRASYSARLRWFQSLDWWKVSCMLRGFAPNLQDDRKSPMDTRRGSERIVERDTFERLHGLLPAQPGDKFRVWGANSFVASPMFGSTFREDVAQHCGFRTLASSSQAKGTHSGLWLGAVDPDAAAAVPGVVSRVKEEAAGRDSSGVFTNAQILGKLFVKRSGNCASKGGETKALVGDALKYADRYALEAGFRQRASRLGVPNARAAWFVRDVPQSMGHAEWRFYEAVCDLRLPDFLRAAPYRMVQGIPS